MSSSGIRKVEVKCVDGVAIVKVTLAVLMVLSSNRGGEIRGTRGRCRISSPHPSPAEIPDRRAFGCSDTVVGEGPDRKAARWCSKIFGHGKTS